MPNTLVEIKQMFYLQGVAHEYRAQTDVEDPDAEQEALPQPASPGEEFASPDNLESCVSYLSTSLAGAGSFISILYHDRVWSVAVQVLYCPGYTGHTHAARHGLGIISHMGV